MSLNLIINSKRMFTVQLSEAGVITTNTLSFNSVFEQSDNHYEYMYSLQEIADDILDLKVNECMYFQGNRDNKECKGIITRFS